MTQNTHTKKHKKNENERLYYKIAKKPGYGNVCIFCHNVEHINI